MPISVIKCLRGCSFLPSDKGLHLHPEGHTVCFHNLTWHRQVQKHGGWRRLDAVSKKSSRFGSRAFMTALCLCRAASGAEKLLLANFSHYPKHSLCCFHADFFRLFGNFNCELCPVEFPALTCTNFFPRTISRHCETHSPTIFVCEDFLYTHAPVVIVASSPLPHLSL